MSWVRILSDTIMSVPPAPERSGCTVYSDQPMSAGHLFLGRICDKHGQEATFFESQREVIVDNYAHRWLAALNKEIYAEFDPQELKSKIKNKSGRPYAYIER